MSGTFISFINLRKVLRMNREVRDRCAHLHLAQILLRSTAESYGLQGPEAYTYTSRSNCLNVASIDDLKDFKDTIVSGGVRYVGRC